MNNDIINKYNTLNNRLNDVINHYNLLLDSINNGINCFNNNIVCGESIDKGVLLKAKKDIENNIEKIKLIMNHSNNRIIGIKEGDINE